MSRLEFDSFGLLCGSQPRKAEPLRGSKQNYSGEYSTAERPNGGLAPVSRAPA